MMRSGKLNDISMEFYKNTDLVHRKKMGQFFTPHEIKNYIKNTMLKEINIDDVKSALEPSVGSGELLTLFSTFDCRVDLCEIDKQLCNELRKQLRSNITLTCADFLLKDYDQRYDLIITNPPYVELRNLNVDLRKSYEKQLSKYVHGRSNIYILFMCKCIDLLNDDGYMVAIIPKNYSTSTSAEPLRKLIRTTCSILCEKTYDAFDDDVGQDVSVVLLRKRMDTKKFKKNKTMEDLGFKCKNGQYVWNQHREDLSGTETGIILVYTSNLDDGFAKNKKTKEKQFIDDYDYDGTFITSVTLLIPRTIGKAKKIRSWLIDPDKEENNYVAENHVIEITHSDPDQLRKLQQHLNDESVIRYLHSCGGTTISIKTLYNIPLDGW